MYIISNVRIWGDIFFEDTNFCRFIDFSAHLEILLLKLLEPPKVLIGRLSQTLKICPQNILRENSKFSLLKKCCPTVIHVKGVD